MSQIGAGSRLNEGKTDFSLFEPWALQQVAQVFTKGKNKYPHPAHNWLQGMAWSKMRQSLQRHLNAYDRGEDYDFYPDTCEGCRNGTCVNHTGELHMAQAAWNTLGLTSYYKWFPQGDDRMHMIMPKPKIGLDIDEVLCNWLGAWIKYWNLPEKPTSWFFDKEILARFDKMKADGTLDDFYMNLEPIIDPLDIPFEPHCYVTSRPIETEVTVAWLEKHGFPLRPVITVGSGKSKVQALKEAGVDIFVDDRFENFEELNRNGICTFLMTAPHNLRYNVGYRRINKLSDLIK